MPRRTRADLAGKERVAARLESDLAALRRPARARRANDARIRTETRALDATRGEIADLRIRVAELDARAGAADAREALERTIPSFFVRINGGVIKVDRAVQRQAPRAR